MLDLFINQGSGKTLNRIFQEKSKSLLKEWKFKKIQYLFYSVSLYKELLNILSYNKEKSPKRDSLLSRKIPCENSDF